jgi:hypothetical protein
VMSSLWWQWWQYRSALVSETSVTSAHLSFFLRRYLLHIGHLLLVFLRPSGGIDTPRHWSSVMIGVIRHCPEDPPAHRSGSPLSPWRCSLPPA